MRQTKASKNEQNKPEVWDLLGQPYGKFNYKVKYSAPSTTHILSKDIMPIGQGEEFNEEDRIIKIVQLLNPRVMGIDVWYDSDDEARKKINVQEHDNSEIIIQNEGNSAKAVSQETPQLSTNS